MMQSVSIPPFSAYASGNCNDLFPSQIMAFDLANLEIQNTDPISLKSLIETLFYWYYSTRAAAPPVHGVAAATANEIRVSDLMA